MYLNLILSDLDKIKAGVDIIQFDGPAFNVFFDEVNDRGVATLERALKGLKCETAVHICYGYGIKANTDWKKIWVLSGVNTKRPSRNCKNRRSISYL